MEERRNGFRDGFLDGFKEGFAEGFLIGFREGIKEGAKTIARRMLADGSVPLEKIAEYVDLPLNEIKSLQAEQSA